MAQHRAAAEVVVPLRKEDGDEIDSELVAAVSANDGARCERALAAGARALTRALIEAVDSTNALSSRERVIRLLLQAGAPVNTRSQWKGSQGTTTPLHLAVWNADARAVAALLEFGADPDSADSWGRLPDAHIDDAEDESRELRALLSAARAKRAVTYTLANARVQP